MKVYLIFLAISVINCADQNEATSSKSFPQILRRIVGGHNSNISDVPYQVALLNFFEILFCGGSIISKNYILTAAHCYIDMDYPLMSTVRVGSSSQLSGGTLLTISNITVHPLYNENKLDYDFALLRLKTPIENFNSNVQSIALPSADHSLKPGSFARLSGWGSLQFNGSEPNILQVLDVPLISWDECQAVYQHLTERMFCSDNTAAGKSPCNGE